MRNGFRIFGILAVGIVGITLMNTPILAHGSTLFTESFENSNFSSRGWYDNINHGSIVAGGKTGNCLQWAWAAGQTQPLNGAALRKKFAEADSLYVSFYVKFQSAWRGSQRNYHPHLIYIPSNLDNNYCPLANNYLNTYIEFVSDIGSPYSIRPSTAIQDNVRVNTTLGGLPNNLTTSTENRSVAHCNGCKSDADCGIGTCYNAGGWYSSYGWKNSSFSMTKDKWLHVETYLKMNSIASGIGQANGVMKMWIDGANVMDYTKIVYRTNQDATKKWAQFVMAPYIGDGSPIAQTMWIDELTVGTDEPYTNPQTTAPGTPKGLRIE